MASAVIGATRRAGFYFFSLIGLGLCTLAWGADFGTEADSEALPPGLLARAQILISENRYAQAFEYLEPYEARGAGDINFNYLFGIAALDSGHTSEAVFALQRVLVQNPGYSAARMELARAYFELNDLEAARREFEALKTQEPPPLARTAIINYLSAINRQSRSYRPSLSYYIQGGGGYDTNANGATDADRFLNFRLDEQNVAQSSSYYEFSYGASFHYPMNEWNQALFVIGARHRRQPSAEFVDLDQAQGGAGLVYDDGRLDVTSMFVWSRSELDAGYPWDADYNSSDVGLEFNLRKQLNNPYWRFLANFRAARVDYREVISVQDVNQFLVSLGYEWSESEFLYRRLGGLLILGYEDARESGSPYGRQQLGYRMYGSRKLENDWWFIAQGGVLYSDYDGRFFGDDRKDTLFNTAIGLDWRPFVDPRWSIQPHVSYNMNNSNVSLFEYNRAEVGMSLKWSSD